MQLLEGGQRPRNAGGVASRSWKRQGKDSPLEPPEGTQHSQLIS